MTGTRCIGNIFCYHHEKAGWLRGKKWGQVVAESDRNLVWHTGGEPITVNLQGVPPDESWAAWQKLGYDAHSVVADPMFVDAERGDYRLRKGSPALKLGFKPIPFAKIGLYKSPDRASWPVADDPPSRGRRSPATAGEGGCWREEHLIYPEGKPTPPAPRARKSIPKLPATRVKPTRGLSLRFNIGVLKAAEREWIAWVSTGGAPWRMDKAGELALK